jgi:CheY-like chemotaxis protein
VLLNLLSNAIKYNRRDGSVTLQVEQAGETRVRLTVRDTGHGIPAGKLERLFIPFDRLDAGQTDVEGTGLGLALSRGLMEAMGGSLGVESREGEGSCFWAELPIAANPGSTPAAARIRGTEPPAGTSAESSHTVLFVEDNLANVRLMERVFSRRPHVRLVVAMQGGLALELARQHRPGLILLDLNLPDVPGDEVLRRLQSDPALRDVPVVMLSGDAMPEQVERLKAEGARAYMTKPFDVLEVLKLVDELLAD